MIGDASTDNLLSVFVKALDKVSEMSGSLKAIEISLNEDVKPDLREIKRELKDKVNVSEYADHRKEFEALNERVKFLETNSENKNAIKKSWHDAFKNFIINWQGVVIILIVIHSIFIHDIAPSLPILSLH